MGAAVAAKLAQLYHFNEIWLELSVVVVSALQLVFDFGGSARVQEFLQQRYYDALSEMESDDLDNPAVQKK